METRLPLPNRRTGKVRDLYDLQLDSGPAVLLVATDRISAYDLLMPTGVPGRGRLLTRMAAFWFWLIQDLAPHHLLSTRVEDIPGIDGDERELLRDRVMLCRRTEVIPMECIVRGYLTGSAWREYEQTGEVGGLQLPPALSPRAKLPKPIFTPSSKAASGHDENLGYQAAEARFGASLVAELRRLSLAIYARAAGHAEARGLLIADTKFEFGRLPNGDILLIDEVLTPDSSRFWMKRDYRGGRAQQSYDKQYLRDYLAGEKRAGNWREGEGAPELPDGLVKSLLARYEEVFRLLQ